MKRVKKVVDRERSSKNNKPQLFGHSIFLSSSVHMHHTHEWIYRYSQFSTDNDKSKIVADEYGNICPCASGDGMQKTIKFYSEDNIKAINYTRTVGLFVA